MRRAWRMAVAAAILAVVASPGGAQAFTLIAVAKVTVSPTSGLASAPFSVAGTYNTSSCTATSPPPWVFTFYWDSTIDFLTSVTVTTCNVSTLTYSTGSLGGFTPPATNNAVGAHQIILVVTTTGGTTAPQGTATVGYTINNPPPPPPRPSPSKPPPPPPSPVRQSPPSTQPSPTTSPSTATSPNCPPGAVTAGCPSPSANACPAAMLPPAGTGGWADNLIAGAMMLAVFPIVGLALFGPGPLWAAISRRRRLLILLGLSVVAAVTLNCTFPSNSTQPLANVSPSATPSCTA